MALDHISPPDRLGAPAEDLRARRVEPHPKLEPTGPSKEDRWEPDSDQASEHPADEPARDVREDSEVEGESPSPGHFDQRA